MNRREEIEAERRRASEEALAGVVRDGEVVGAPGVARTLEAGAARLRGHFGAEDADPDDAAEVWGRRIGRGLALIVAAGLVWHLATTYVLR
ncbi:MAG: hypothetical protein LWW93_03940 [Hyphomicrobiales bacterium]|nr:hypothetical protein [Hyphomicrobiales bacterium]